MVILSQSGADAWRELAALYRDDGDEAASIRAQHLASVQRLTPPMMAANVLNAGVVGFSIAQRDPLRFALWAAVLLACVGTALHSYRVWRRRQPQRASRSAFHRSTMHAGSLAAVWAAVPVLWFASGDPAERIIVATLTTGMMSAGAFVLAPVPLASLAYVGVLTLGATIALALSGEPMLFWVGALLLVYAAICGISSVASGRKSLALLRSEREAERQRRTVSLLLSDFEEHAAEGLWETGADGRLTHASARLRALLAPSGGELLGRLLPDVLAVRSPGGGHALAAAFAGSRSFRALAVAVPNGDALAWWKVSAKPVLDDGYRVQGWRGVIVDATAEISAERELRRMAHTDSLTGLANRATLHDALRAQLATGAGGALFSIDLDHFKAINDTLGHSTGDRVLVAVAARIGGMFRPEDVVARLGGDEFAVLVRSPIDEERVLALARRLVAAFDEPCAVNGRSLVVGLSAGVALLGVHGTAQDELLGNADLALYEAKRAGRGRCAVYAARLGESSRRRAEIEQALKHAIDANELALAWQPQVEVGSWRVIGAEALLRWRHPTLGVVGPAEFIAVAEQTGMASRIGTWVLRAACREAVRSLPGLDVSVNISTIQLRDDFVATVREVLAETGLAPERLQLELTESIFLGDDSAALANLRALQSLGVRVALDDFGTGYSSLAYLRRFPFDTLKIDRAFVSELTARADMRAIVRTILQLGESLRIRTVAEGVETEAQLALLTEHGCQMVQGYLVAKPTDVATLARALREWRAAPAARAALH